MTVNPPEAVRRHFRSADPFHSELGANHPDPAGRTFSVTDFLRYPFYNLFLFFGFAGGETLQKQPPVYPFTVFSTHEPPALLRLHKVPECKESP